MTQVLIKNIPSTFSGFELNFEEKIDKDNKNSLIELIEYLEDYLYVSEREKNEGNIEYSTEKSFENLISKYK